MFSLPQRNEDSSKKIALSAFVFRMLELLCHGVRRIGRRHTVCSLFLLLAFFTGQPAESNPLGKQQADEDVSDSCKGKANGVCGSNHTSFQWAKTKYGSIAFKAGDCPCGLALESIGDAMPYLPVVFRMLTKRKDYAILVGKFLPDAG